MNKESLKQRLRSIRIWSDKQSALAAIYSSIINSKLVLEITELIEDLGHCAGIKVLGWCRGHKYETGNEFVDF